MPTPNHPEPQYPPLHKPKPEYDPKTSEHQASVVYPGAWAPGQEEK